MILKPIERMEEMHGRVHHALQKVQEILHDTKVPQMAPDVTHTYDDKFLLGEHLTSLAIRCVSKTLSQMGIKQDLYSKLHEINKNSTVWLRANREERCSFIKKEKVKMKEGVEYETTIEEHGFIDRVFSHKDIYWEMRYFWEYTVMITLRVHDLDNNEDIIINNMKLTTTLMTKDDKSPKHDRVVKERIEMSLNWWLESINNDGEPYFHIDRKVESCKTPRRNEDITRALDFITNLNEFCSTISEYLWSLFNIQQNKRNFDMKKIYEFSIFVPLLPIFCDRREIQPGDLTTNDVIMHLEESEKLLNQEESEMNIYIKNIRESFPEDDGLMVHNSVILYITCKHGRKICSDYNTSIDFIENMLRDQLVSAIGKIISPLDFLEYMQYRNRQLLKPQYQAIPFMYNISRPNNSPEGVISIEMNVENRIDEPIITQVYENKNDKVNMHFYLNAATKVYFQGQQFIHCWMDHKFKDNLCAEYQITARTRQYSCYILMLGNISSSNEFNPTNAMILENKDEYIIPILFEELPSAQEFQDAVESLSPEQQRFAKAYRSMQLESTLFGICIVQIKPQLEKLLNLPNQSLTKERRLTQQLMKLFTEYQISSDVLKYRGSDDVDVTNKIMQVSKSVENILEEIEKEKKKQLQEIKQKEEYIIGKKETIYQDRHTLDMKGFAPGGVGGRGGGQTKGRSFFGSRSRKKSQSTTDMRKKSPKMEIKQQSQPVVVVTTAATDSIKDTITTTTNTNNNDNDNKNKYDDDEDEEDRVIGIDYTKIPALMDSKFLSLDKDGALRSRIIKLCGLWSKKTYASILAKSKIIPIEKTKQKEARDKAFDLLDALSRSGQLSLDNTMFHVILPVSHLFTNTLMNTLVQDNINPIEKVDKSVLLVTSIINRTNIEELVNEGEDMSLLIE